MLYKRIDLNLYTTVQADADSFVSDINDQFVVGDRWTGDDAQVGKNLDIVSQVSVDKSATYEVVGSVLCSVATKADTLYNYVKDNAPASIKGIVSIHFCPEEGTVNNWEGCKDDSRAEYQENIFV